ncbi:MAG: LysE family transporter [Ignisphaera sp.]
MEWITKIVCTTVMISASGALSPGPLTIATFSLGSRYGWRSGFLVAVGHTIAELFYIVFLFYFFSLAEAILKGLTGDILSVFGATLVLFFALSSIREGLLGLKHGKAFHVSTSTSSLKNPIVVGILFTGLNIWFLVWWLSIGIDLISLATKAGFIGIPVLFLSHIWLDYLWLCLVAEAGRRGRQIMDTKSYSILILALGIILAVFGINMVIKRFTPYAILP